MNKTTSIIITIVLVFVIGIIFFGKSWNRTDSPVTVSAQNVEVKDGVQYITISARGGYSPQVTTAQADMPTKLVVKTNGTYDCSAALVIRSINFEKILSPTAEEVIDLDTPKAGTLQGLCSMGMYNFSVNFN